MVETTMGADSVTGKQVASEGLLQLSYQDIPNYGALLKYPACKIDWQKDKALTVNGVRRVPAVRDSGLWVPQSPMRVLQIRAPGGIQL